MSPSDGQKKLGGSGEDPSKNEIDFEKNQAANSYLLENNETIRDPVQGDISITLLERAIIDTEEFQRLRKILQLGACHFVYPGATHTRFSHSLGTLHMATKMYEMCNINHEKYSTSTLLQVTKYQQFLIRITALIHDLAHVPFSHTLTREGGINPEEEWDNVYLMNTLIGDENAEVRKKIFDIMTKAGITKIQFNQFMADLKDCLTKNKDFRYQFVIDMVSNTLCADLLDYVLRDSYYCGLKERIGDRFLSYLGIVSLDPSKNDKNDGSFTKDITQTNGHLVLLSYRIEKDTKNPSIPKPVESKRDIQSEAVDLLRKRFSIAEKVYFHRTKIAASAMIIEAVASHGKFKEKPLKYGDDSFINELASSSDDRTKNLIGNLSRRNIYKPIYMIKHITEDDSSIQSDKLWGEGGIYHTYRKPNERLKIEKKFEELFELGPGNVVIYCPDREMNLKKFEMIVQPGERSKIRRLRDTLDSVRSEEIDAVEKSYNQLWSFYVFVNPEKLDPSDIQSQKVKDFVGLCESTFGLSNEIRSLSNIIGKDETDLIAKPLVAEIERETGKVVPFKLVTEVMEESRRDGWKTDKKRIKEEIKGRMT